MTKDKINIADFEKLAKTTPLRPLCVVCNGSGVDDDGRKVATGVVSPDGVREMVQQECRFCEGTGESPAICDGSTILTLIAALREAYEALEHYQACHYTPSGFPCHTDDTAEQTLRSIAAKVEGL